MLLRGMLKSVQPRLYQETILASAVNKNTLVVLPTGMGKTLIAVMLAAHRLQQYPQSKILFLSPTKPLAEQHYRTFQESLDIPKEKFVLFTGNVAPQKRQALWQHAQLIFSTPQGLENDLLGRKISLQDVSLLVFDEAHRAVGDYAYVFIAQQFHKQAKYARILSLTASPGTEQEKILEICKNLYIEEVEIRHQDDPDVKPYIQTIDVSWEYVELPSVFTVIKQHLEKCYNEKLHTIKKFGYLNRGHLNKSALLALQRELHGKIARGERDFAMLKSISLLAEALKIQHGLELLETQGITALHKYLEKINEESKTSKVKAVQNLVRDLHFRTAVIQTRKLFEEGIEHPKLGRLKQLIQKEITPGAKIIIFSQYRDSAAKIVEEVNTIDGVTAKIFVGQAKKGGSGMRQKEQIQLLQDFKAGLFNVLVATSVAEEGLDIPRVDTVIFYEPIPSAIRHIQRRGRTGRQEKGKVFVLVAKGTRDEGYRWSAYHKEKRMHRLLRDMQNKIGLALHPQKQVSLENFTKPSIQILADYREKGSEVLKALYKEQVVLTLERLASADYVLSGRVGVELKTVQDFVTSIIDGRLLEQAKNLKKNFEKPLLIIEGSDDIYSVRKMHPNSIRGMLATLIVGFGIPVIQTKNSAETASLLYFMAKREQELDKQGISAHADRKPMTKKELQEYIVAAFPGIGSKLAKPILKSFKSIKNFINASEEALKSIPLIGTAKAKAIKEIFDKEYED